MNCRHADFQSAALPTELPGRTGKAGLFTRGPRPCPAAERLDFLLCWRAFRLLIPLSAPAPAPALEQALTAETRRGVLFAIAARGLFFALLVGNFVVGLLARVQLPSYLRLPWPVLLFALAINLFAVAIYLFAAHARRPLLWCFVAMVTDMLLLAEFKFFWFWAPPGLGGLPLFLEVRYLDIVSFIVILCFYMLPMSRRLVSWTGARAAATWIAGIVLALAAYRGARLYLGPLDAAVPASSGSRLISSPQ